MQALASIYQKTHVVALTGIEPVSGASETLILSIVLQSH